MDEFLIQNPIAFVVVAGILGGLVGSFLNVVIYRLPVMIKGDWQNQCYEFLNEYESRNDDNRLINPNSDQSKFNLVVPRSRCQKCKKQLTALDNIPIFSYLFLKGKCRYCSTTISARYPLIEILSALLTAFAAYHFQYGLHFLMIALLSWGLIALSMIDYDHKILPDSIVLSLIWIGLLYSPYNPIKEVTPITSLIGAAAGYLILWIVANSFKLITGKDGMGNGDFKLLAVFGAWLGWMILPLIIVLSSFVGALIGIGLIIFKGRDRNNPIPFGPYLAIAGLISVYWGADMINGYLNYSGIV